MNQYDSLYQSLRALNAHSWAEWLPEQIAATCDPGRHGKWAEWLKQIDNLPSIRPTGRLLDIDAVTIGSPDDLTENQLSSLEQQLLGLSPWRKGPFDLFGIYIDSEWRSNWKWWRLEPHITPLQGRTVLDVGCGNGYYAWRMLGCNAKLVIGIEPLPLHVAQFFFTKKLAGGDLPVHVLPLRLEDLPPGLRLFDTVFSMGVLYHRRSPIDHLMELKECLVPGGELVLETLAIEGKLGEVLVPENRYAQMRNVWFIPTPSTLLAWLARCGFQNIRLVDLTATTVDEQRRTPWMTSQSLHDFLDPNNPNLTKEGLPAPKRGIFIANSPSP